MCNDYHNDSDGLIFVISLLHSHIRCVAYIYVSVQFVIIIELINCRYSCATPDRARHMHPGLAK